MNYKETVEFLETLPLYKALWWFIENIGDTSGNEYANQVFFYLRARVRTAHYEDARA